MFYIQHVTLHSEQMESKQLHRIRSKHNSELQSILVYQ